MPRAEKKIVPIRRGGGGEVVRERVTDLDNSHNTTPHPRKLSFGEEKLSQWLRKRFRMIGAIALVRQYGGKVVVEQLHDGIVSHNGFEHVVDPGIRNPGAFLRYLLENQID